jgi:CBS domain-containing protein
VSQSPSFPRTASDRPRNCLCAIVGFEAVHLRRPADNLRLHQRNTILLSPPRGDEQNRPIPPQQSTRCALLPSPHKPFPNLPPAIEKDINVTPIETSSIHPLRPLYEACRRMLESRARRIPLVDIDDETKRAMVVSVITQYRILKFVAVNVTETQLLRKPLKLLNLGTYKDLETAKMETPVLDVIQQLVHKNISSVPIINSDRTSSLPLPFSTLA